MRRTVVTGIGVVAPGGTSRDAFWEAITNGRTATRRTTLFDPEPFRAQIAAEVDWDPAAAGLEPDQIERMDRYVQFAMVAAVEALEDSELDLDAEDRERIGVTMGSAVGGTTYLENEYVRLSDNGQLWLVDPEDATPWVYHALVPSTLAGELAARYATHGPAMVVSTGCTSGIDALGYGHHLIQDGEADIVIAGAAESPVSPISVACFDSIRATSTRNDDPEHALRPFDLGRDGFVMGEGAAVLILEEMEHARARGARIYCELTGYAIHGNAFHMTGLKPDGADMARAITEALEQGGTAPEDVDYISAHGSGTKQNDIHETAACKAVLGQRAHEIPMSSIKSMVGHSLGSIGAIEMAACALAIDRGMVPPTANYETPDPECDLDYVPDARREHHVDVALSVGSGFGGFQSAMVFSRPGEVEA